MEKKQYGGQSNFREEALQGALYELSKNILQDIGCNRAFRIYEKKFLGENGKIMFRFYIDEIGINMVNINIPKNNYININKKYSFKERLRILFKGE